ncbi:MAG TPA: hypothetical protein VK646_04615, partial [Actinomycetota bacterium]|nr:hypothetical protein [Actinomycetota bacterium]
FSVYPGGSFTPDGSQVVYEGPGGIYSVAADGGSPRRRLALDAMDGLYQPVLSPDGSRLAFFLGHGDVQNSLWVMNIDGTDKRRIVGEDQAGRAPWSLQWSPDGTRLAFRGESDRSFGVVNADGSGLTLISANIPVRLGSDAGPYWSPDGTRLAFTIGSVKSPSLAIARPDGTELQAFSGEAGPWNPLDPAPTA